MAENNGKNAEEWIEVAAYLSLLQSLGYDVETAISPDKADTLNALMDDGLSRFTEDYDTNVGIIVTQLDAAIDRLLLAEVSDNPAEN